MWVVGWILGGVAFLVAWANWYPGPPRDLRPRLGNRRWAPPIDGAAVIRALRGRD